MVLQDRNVAAVGNAKGIGPVTNLLLQPEHRQRLRQ